MPIITDSTIRHRWNSFYGKTTVNSFQQFNKSGINSIIRVNYLKTSDDDLIPKLEKKGFILEKLELSGAYKVVKNTISLGATNEYLYGQYAIQGLASQFVSHVVNPQPNDTILDMSAAPGGKTAHMSSLMNNKGLIVATDSSKHRMTALRSNLARLDVKNVIGLQVDATTLPSSFGYFTKILLDAPCTGSGSICKRPEEKWLKGISDIKRLAEKQTRLLEKAVQLLQPGGDLIFSTCSIEPEEGELQIAHLLTAFQKKFELIDITESNNLFIPSKASHPDLPAEFLATNESKWLRITPNEDYEGFFICKLRKKE